MFWLSVQGAYIPPVLHATPKDDHNSSKDHSHSSYGYQSFGSTDRMGRKTPSQTPTPTLSPTPQPQLSATSTLERSAHKLKPGGSGGPGVVGGGAGGGVSTAGKIIDKDQPKPFV